MVLLTSLLNILNKVGNNIRRHLFVFFDFEALLYSYLHDHDRFFFVQIGACDGVSYDPLYKFVVRNHRKVKGIVVEPIKEYFEQLKKNYKRYPQIVAVNAAIHTTEKEMPLYRADPKKKKELPKWTKGIASFYEHHHTLSGTPSDAIIKEMVPCLSFNDLLKRFEITNIDLLQIDTEGYDAEIICNIDFNLVRPKIIRFEHGFTLGIMKRETLLKVIGLLHDEGYELALEKDDATAYQRSIIVDA